MGRLSASLLALLLGGASAVALVSCGGGSDAKLLPGTTAAEIEANLDQVRLLASSGDCTGAEEAVAEVAAEVEELEDVAVKLQLALEEGTARLSEVVGGCEEETTEEEPEPAPETDVEAEAVEEQEKQKKEKPEKDEEEPAAPEEEEAEPEEEPELPPQSEGKGEEKGGGPPEGTPAPPGEGSPSGGVAPAVGAE